jgi:hypothetical protein
MDGELLIPTERMRDDGPAVHIHFFRCSDDDSRAARFGLLAIAVRWLQSPTPPRRTSSVKRPITTSCCYDGRRTLPTHFLGNTILK